MAAQCKKFRAWVDKKPPPPDRLHVVGEATVGNPGVMARLVKRAPQGINPAILILDLVLEQKPGNWIQVESCAEARYDAVLDAAAGSYSGVEIHSNGALLIFIDSIEVTH